MSSRGDPPADLRSGRRLRLAALGCRPRGIRARLLDSAETVFVRPGPFSPLPVEGEVFELEVERVRRVGPRRWLSGPLSGVRLDAVALGLEPLALVEPARRDAWRKGHQERWRRRGHREYELERIPAEARAEAILHRAIDLWAGGRLEAARALVDRLLRSDLRCLAAHSCLGFLAFNSPPGGGGSARARRHYAAGLEIAGLSVPADLDGVMPWSLPGNRPFLRCLYGHSICLWRHGELAAARAGFLRLCRLSPSDQLAARLALDHIERGSG